MKRQKQTQGEKMNFPKKTMKETIIIKTINQVRTPRKARNNQDQKAIQVQRLNHRHKNPALMSLVKMRKMAVRIQKTLTRQI